MTPGLKWTNRGGVMRTLTVEEMMRQIPVGNRSTPTDPRRGFYLRGVPLWSGAVRKVSTVEACRAGAVKANERMAEQRRQWLAAWMARRAVPPPSPTGDGGD